MPFETLLDRFSKDGAASDFSLVDVVVETPLFYYFVVCSTVAIVSDLFDHAGVMIAVLGGFGVLAAMLRGFTIGFQEPNFIWASSVAIVLTLVWIAAAYRSEARKVVISLARTESAPS